MEKKTILIIEDEPTINRIISSYFQKANYEVISALNGAKGLELFNANHVDIICLDIMIPKINGWQVAKTIRETSNVPIVMMSALSSEDDILKGYSLNVDDYITKPFPPMVLIAKINSLLERIEYSKNGSQLGTFNLDGITIDFDSFDDDHRLKELLTHDDLTGLSNRRFLDFYIENMKKNADDFHESFGVLFVDIDHFKQINDTFGHATGDGILKMVAKTLKTNIRNNDLIARYGGEEFVGVIHVDNSHQLFNIAEKLRILIEKEIYKHNDENLSVTVSIGGCLYTRFDSIENTIKTADSLMYESKNNGRNKVTVK